MTPLFAYAGCLVLAALAVFQAALIAGAPIGRFAWGGGHDVLPRRLRIGSVVSIILYAFFAALLLSKSGVWELFTHDRFVDTAMWVSTVYFFVGVVMNGVSRSKPERLLMTPVALVLAIVFLMVARS